MIRVCIIGRNHEDYTEQCLLSVLAETTTGHVIDWTDDASVSPSNYGATLLAERMLHRPHRVERREERRGGLANLWHAIQRAEDDDVCVLMGGDDWLEPGALERVAKEYENPETWLTYGTYRNERRQGTPCAEGDAEPTCYEWDGCDIRPHDFLWAPLTCKAWLAKKILVEDLKIAGWWQWSGGDVALNVPMVEMAGPEHARFIADVWYTRRLHDGNDATVDCNLQYYCNWVAYGRPRYSRLASRADTPVRTPHKVKYSLLFSPMLAAPRAVAF